jgi:hypothetical protein
VIVVTEPARPRCATCGFLMCELFDEKPINAIASTATPNGKFWCYHCKSDIQKEAL